MSSKPDSASNGLKLGEALRIVNGAATDQERAGLLGVGIACGFTPLHLETFIKACALRARPQRQVRTSIGVYGDLVHALSDVVAQRPDVVLAFVEWSDLDPRLSSRRAGRVAVPGDADLLQTVSARLDALERSLLAAAATATIVLSYPSLPFPAFRSARRGQLGPLEAAVRARVGEHAATMACHPDIRVLTGVQVVADLHAEVTADFPYSVRSASVLADAMVELALPTAPKKGLITDLDDTLWQGLVGEVGRNGVTWSIDDRSQVHAMYQQLLSVLAGEGVLLAVVSKNDPQPVAAALGRDDLGLAADSLFPVVASWQPKSVGVTEVLRVWNVAAADVVFVDDSRIELAEVAVGHPGITTLQFGAPVDRLLVTIRDLFFRDRRDAEDALRVASVKAGARFTQDHDHASDRIGFLRDLVGRLIVRPVEADESRPYELVQKTNQFNLNGRRYESSQWRQLVSAPGRLTLSVEYADRFGALGVISVLSGESVSDGFVLDCWVLSCRAFSRAIEHHILAVLGGAFGLGELRLDFAPTARNSVLQQFLSGVATGEDNRPVIARDALVETGLTGIHSVDVHEVVPTRESKDARHA